MGKGQNAIYYTRCIPPTGWHAPGLFELHTTHRLACTWFIRIAYMNVVRISRCSKQDGLGLFVIKPGAPACGTHTPGFLKLLLCGCLYICVCVCVCPPPRLLITSDVMWTLLRWRYTKVISIIRAVRFCTVESIKHLT